MNPGLLLTALAALAGMFVAAQAPTNALLGRASGSALMAAFISFAVGTLALGLILAGSGGLRWAPALKLLPAHAWAGGLYGAMYVVVAAFAAPRIGVGALLTAAVAGQLIAALLLDHFGLLGLSQTPATPARVAGVLLVLVGAWLVRRG